ncbi:ATP-binding protein [Lachnoclostridium sp. Marseille-P6806]|uniref:ATP-binding protein n=1 Tax=Lachnoclostridium sp. Marseille-P6806 TaxID=2364793 RepID=UPI001F5E8BF7|nr:ATP-binding protein [Lachnoclostridium sp. Marseille-P6806]
MTQTATPETIDTWGASSYVILDIRDAEDYEKDHIPSSIHMELPQLLAACESGEATALLPSLPRDRRILVICRRGQFSGEAAERLRACGYHACSLEGGYGAWVWHAAQKAAADAAKRERIESSIRGRFKRDLFGLFTRAVVEYRLVEPNDRIAVCISGGKDSMCMAKLFQELKRHNKFPFELVFLVMDPGYNEQNRRVIESNAALLGIPVTIFETEIFDSVYNVEKSPCYLCARMRRGYLYKKAKELGCNKIALGHHYDDVIETLLMGMLYSGQFQAMMPKLHSQNYAGMQLIRPMYLIRESEICRWRDYNGLHFIQCACKFTDNCSSEACRANGNSASKRAETKRLIAELKKTNPYVEANIFRSMENVPLNKLLGWKEHGERHSFLEKFDADDSF